MNEKVKRISAFEARPLRQEILRPGQAVEAVTYERDDEGDSGHFGFYVGAEIVGVGTVIRSAHPKRSGENQWRLRGMAVKKSVQKTGVGEAILKACLQHVKANGAEMLWCTARSHVLAFYERYGFHAEGDEFEIPGGGPHFLMSLEF